MKKLNQNNAIVTTAMLTKMNTMKNKMNFFAKVVMLVAMMGILLPQVACGQEPWFNDGSWWILKKESIYMGNLALSSHNKNTDNFSVYIPGTGATVTYSAWIENEANNWPDFYLKVDNVKVIDGINNSKQCDRNRKYCANDKHSETYNISNGSKHVQGFEEHNGCSQTRRVDIKIPLPRHTDVLQGTRTYTFNTPVVIGNTSAEDVTINFAQFFKSFYTSGDITATITGEDASCFHFGSADGGQSLTIASAGSVYANSSCFTGGSGLCTPASSRIYFTPTAAKDYSVTIHVTYDNNQSFDIQLTATGAKKTPTFTWTSNKTLAVGTIYPVSEIATVSGYSGQVYLTTSDVNKIQVLDNQDNVVTSGRGVKVRAIAAETAQITALIDGNDNWNPGSDSENFTGTNLAIQRIDWTQNLTGFKQGDAPTTLDAVAIDQTSGQHTSDCGAITYQIIGDQSIVSINGNVLTINAVGETSIQATAAQTATHAQATTIRTVKVRRADDTSCDEYALQVNGNITSSGAEYSFNGKTPEFLSGVTEWRGGATGTSYIYEVFANGSTHEVYHKRYTGDSWSAGSESIQNGTYSNKVPINPDAISLRFDGDINDRKYYTNIKVTQKSFLNPTTTTSKDFGRQSIGGTHEETISAADYSNLNSDVTVSLTGDNADQFAFKLVQASLFDSNDKYVTAGCGAFGHINVIVQYQPTTTGNHSCTLHLEGKINTQTVPVDIALSGNGGLLSQTLSWNDMTGLSNLTSLTTKPDNQTQTNRIQLLATTDARDGDNNPLPITYTSSNESIAKVVNGCYLEIYKAGEVSITASQPGNEYYMPASNDITKVLTITKVTPNLTVTGNQTPEVFSTFQVSASSTGSSDGYSRASDGKITFTIESTYDNKPTASISDYVEANKTCSVTVNTRGTEDGVPTQVVAHLAATDIYEAKTETLTVNATKVTPELQCSIQSLERTALTDLYLTDMPVTITNSTTLWHDIAVTYSSNDESIAKLDGDHFSLLKSGTCTITAKVNAGVNNNASSNTIEIPLTVNYASQSITWNDNLTGPYNVGQAAVGPLTATASSGMTVNYSDCGKGIVSIGSDNKISFLKAGYTAITASQPGDERYSAAENIQKHFKVDFATDVFLPCSAAVIGTPSTTTLDMSQWFVPSGNGEYSASAPAGSEFSVTEVSGNTITIKFDPTSVDNGNDTQEKSCGITITDNGQTYTFYVKATAEKKNASLVLDAIGNPDPYVFSTITPSLSTQTTDAASVTYTYNYNGGTTTGVSFKLPSIDPGNVTATTLATTVYKAGTSNTITVNPQRVTPKVINWSGSSSHKVGESSLLDADWKVDENVDANQPAKEEWADGEVTIVYTSSNDVAEVNDSNLVFHKAGLATITASIPEENNHNASTDNPTKLVKVDFADDASIDCGTAYVGESPATYDITDMIVLTGTGAGAMTATSDNPEFSVDFSNGMVVVGFRPTSYNETGSGTITFTETVDGVQYEYHLNVTGHCDKHTPLIDWIDGRLLQSNPTQENRQLTDLLKSYAFIDGATIASSDTSVIKVFDSKGQPVDNNVPGRTFWVHDEGQATITIDVPETGNHWSKTETATFDVTNDKIRTIVWDQQDILNNLYVGDAPLYLTAHVVDKNGDVVGTVSYSSGNNGIVSASGDSLTIVAVGITTLTATASTDSGYTTPTLTYNVEVKEPNTTACPEHDIYQGTRNITAVDTVEFYKDDKGRYYPAGELTYSYALSKNGTIPYTQIPIYRTITISPDGPVDHSVIVSYTQDSIASQSGSGITIPIPKDATGLAYGGKISGEGGADISAILEIFGIDLNPYDGNNYFTVVKVTQATYLEAGNLTSYDFGTQTVGEPERVLLSGVAKYSHINGPVRAIITSGNEYFKVVDSEQNNFGSATDCYDFGDVNVMVEYVADDDDTVHTGTLTIVGYIGEERIEIPVTLTGKSEKMDPVITWDAGTFLRAGDNTLHATTSATGATVSYALVSPTDNPDMQITGPDAYGNWSIYIPSGDTGNVQVKAISSETKSYNRGDSIKTFTITTKKIQTIVWPAGFENGATILVGDEGKDVSGFGTDPEGGTVNVVVSVAGSTGASITGNILSMTNDGIVSLTATATRSGDEYEDAVETRTFYLTKGGSCNPYCLSQTITRAITTTTYPFASGSTPVALSGTLTGTNLIFASSYTIQDNNGKTISQGSGINKDGSISGYTFTGTETGIKVTELTTRCTLAITVSQKTDKILFPSSGNTIAFGEYELLKESTAEEATIEYWNMPYMVASLEGDNASEFRYEQVVTGETAKCNCHGKIKYKLYFKPTTEGEKTCTFKIEYSTIEPPLILTLTGKGKKIQPVITLVKPLPDDMNVFDTVPLEGSDDDTYTKAVPALPIKYVALASAESTEPSDVAVVDTIDGIQCLRFYKKGNFYLKAYIEEGTYNKAAEYIFDKDTVVRGTLKFIVAGKWTDAEKWSRPDIVRSYTDKQIYDYSDYNVLIADSCFIGKDSATVENENDFLIHTVNAACHDLSFANEKKAKLVIGEASTLNVKGNLTNDDADKLLLTANYWGQASVVFGNDGSIEHPNPKATIEMYIPEGNGSHIDPKWQYRGICVNDFKAVDGPWECMAIYLWKEADNGNLENGCWNHVTNGGGDKNTLKLSPWTGYCFANICSDDERKAENWLTYTGTLINSASHEYILTRTENRRDDGTLYENCGVNLLTNSYAAPMTIGDIDFDDNNDDAAYATVTFYNAGSHKDWKDHHSDATDENQHGDPGQMTVCPKITGGTVQNTFTIPAGQSFFVTAKNNNNTVTFDYSIIKRNLSPSHRMFLPAERESEYNVLGIRVKGKENGDRLVLLECETCTRQYDNGYDGYKMPGKEGLPQIYAYNKFGNTAVNADSTLNKQYVGFMAGSDDETYTISFETDRLFGYHSLFLTDRKLNETVDILAGETYQFKGYTVGENMRFQINGITEQEWNNDDDDDDDDDDDSNVCDLRVVGNTLYVQGFTTDHYLAARIELFDMTGNLVWSTPLTSERLYDLPSLPQGIYTIRLGDCHTKYVSR